MGDEKPKTENKPESKLSISYFKYLVRLWVASGQVESGKYRDRRTCKPNCDSKVGGPPLVTLALCFLYVFMYVGYKDFGNCFEANYGVTTFGIFNEFPPALLQPVDNNAVEIESENLNSTHLEKDDNSSGLLASWYCTEALAFYPWLRQHVYRYYRVVLLKCQI